ncbi:MAG: hypothetical protein LBT95_05370 [Treponema sp.]|jgi:hypothetical protein|nr:hypothetical protein [Treponema sp.]
MKRITKYNPLVLLGIGLVLMVLLGSCDTITGFFSKSWGSGLARDLAKLLPPITAKNAEDLANDTAGDPNRAKIVAEKIREALEKATDPAEKAALLRAGLIAANNASDLITVMMGNIDTFSDPTTTTVGTVLGKVQEAGNLQDNAQLVSGLLDAAGPETSLAGVSQDSLVLAAATLLLADAQENDYTDPTTQEEYLDTFKEKKADETSLTTKQKQAITLAAAAANKDGALKEVLGYLNL